MNASPERRRSAFTLVELVVVIALLAIMAGVVVPRMNFGAVHKAEAQKAALDVAGYLRMARSLALSDAGANASGYKLLLTSTTYDLQKASTSASVKGVQSLPSGVSVSGDTTFHFDRFGELVGGSGKSATFAKDGASHTVYVTAVGGVMVVAPNRADGGVAGGGGGDDDDDDDDD